MIGTLAIKQQQLKIGTFSVGSGPEVILIMGSCRAVPYLNYLHQLNTHNRFTIHFIDPFNWNWDLKDDRVDYQEALSRQQTNPHLLRVLQTTKIFIHEYYNNAGMFNVNPDHNNIYSYGLKPALDITIPNFNDVFILTKEIVSFDMDIRKKAIQDYNVIGKLSDKTLADIESLRNQNLEKFCQVCLLTDFPEFKDIFMSQYKTQRFFLTFNHVSKQFTLAIFKLMNNKFLHVPISDTQWLAISEHDMYAGIFTSLCEYDQGYNWGEPIEKLKI